jgi:hypothetical protein
VEKKEKGMIKRNVFEKPISSYVKIIDLFKHIIRLVYVAWKFSLRLWFSKRFITRWSLDALTLVDATVGTGGHDGCSRDNCL